MYLLVSNTKSATKFSLKLQIKQHEKKILLLLSALVDFDTKRKEMNL